MTGTGSIGAAPDRVAAPPFPSPVSHARRLLLVTYHFAPSREAGALRWIKLARFAVERGYLLDVIALDPASLKACDWPTLETLPPGVRVYGIPESQPTIDRVMRWGLTVRAWLRRIMGRHGPVTGCAPPSEPEPDTRPESLSRSEMRGPEASGRDAVRAYNAWRDYARGKAWARRAARLAAGLLARNRYAAVISCGPPHMAHFAGLRIARAARLPFVMDHRDLWSCVPRLPESVASPLWYAMARRYERRAIRHASLVVMNTELSRTVQAGAYPDLADRVIAVMNGYDDEPLPASRRGRCFVMAYTGSVYLDRDPRPLFRAVARIVTEQALAPGDLRLEFMGATASYGGTTLATMAEQEGIAAFVGIQPSRPRHEALQLLADAALLVSLPQDTVTAIPSKIFEYLRFNAWLLALTNPDSATAQVLAGTGADVIAPEDLEGIAAAIRRRYLAYAAGQRPRRLLVREDLSRRAQADKFFDALVTCITASEQRRVTPRHRGVRRREPSREC